MFLLYFFVNVWSNTSENIGIVVIACVFLFSKSGFGELWQAGGRLFLEGVRGWGEAPPGRVIEHWLGGSPPVGLDGE